MTNEEFEKLVKDSKALIDEINAMNKDIDMKKDEDDLSVWDIESNNDVIAKYD